MEPYDEFKNGSSDPKQIVQDSEDNPESIFMNWLSALQTHMLSLCNDYAKGYADKIYIHCYLSDSGFSVKDGYEVNGKLVNGHILGEVIKGVAHKDEPLCKLMHDIVDVYQVLKDANQQIPFEIKIIFDAKKQLAYAKWNYPPLPKGVHEVIAGIALSELWFEEVGFKNKTVLNLLRHGGQLGPAGPDTSTPSPLLRED